MILGCIARSMNSLEHAFLSKSCKERMFECMNQKGGFF